MATAQIDFDAETLASLDRVEARRGAATPDQVETARAIIARAEAVGYIREPSAGNAYDFYLLEDADDAEAFLDDLADNDPERCPDCDALQLCDCLIYPAAYGRIYPEYLT